MKVNKQLIVLSLALTCSSMFATSSVAKSEERQSDPIAIYREAGATPEQQQKIKDLAKEFESGVGVKAERAKNLFKKMQGFSLQPMPDEKSVLATQDELNSLQSEMDHSRIKLMLKIRGILTPDQRTKLVDIMKQRMNAGPGAQ